MPLPQVAVPAPFPLHWAFPFLAVDRHQTHRYHLAKTGLSPAWRLEA
jgi:hypothetical protein